MDEHGDADQRVVLRVWLDDVRRPPSEDWTWVKSVDQAIAILAGGAVCEISLDNDLHPFVRDGLEVCEWMHANDVWPGVVHVHTDNRFASTKMCGLLQRSRYERVPGRVRSFRRDADQGDEGSTMNNQTEPAIEAEDSLRVWLDDDLVDRAAPDGWIHVTTAWEAIRLLDSGKVIELSLDHDLSDDEQFGRGIDVVNWLAEQQEVYDRPLWPRDGITLHTANPPGREAMARAIRTDAGRRFLVVESHTPGNKPVFKVEPK